jgi:hypothetical protein
MVARGLAVPPRSVFAVLDYVMRCCYLENRALAYQVEKFKSGFLCHYLLYSIEVFGFNIKVEIVARNEFHPLHHSHLSIFTYP